MEVTLNKVQQRTVDQAPEAIKSQLREHFLALNQAKATKQSEMLNKFSISINDFGNLTVSGLGVPRPFSISADALLKLLTHSSEIQTYVTSNRAAIDKARSEAGPKIKALREQRKAKLAVVR